MKNILRLEEVLMLAAAIILNYSLPFPGWLFWVLFLSPDISMLGYLVNTRTGAVLYNIFHHKGIALFLYLAGQYVDNQPLQFVGILLFAHASFDRIFGYGLKYSNNFRHTHLGWIGKVNE